MSSNNSIWSKRFWYVLEVFTALQADKKSVLNGLEAIGSNN